MRAAFQDKMYFQFWNCLMYISKNHRPVRLNQKYEAKREKMTPIWTLCRFGNNHVCKKSYSHTFTRNCHHMHDSKEKESGG